MGCAFFVDSSIGRVRKKDVIAYSGQRKTVCPGIEEDPEDAMVSLEVIDKQQYIVM